MELAIALANAGIDFIHDSDPESPKRLDFYLPIYDLHIEVKGGETPRIAKQLARDPNVIVVQGRKSVQFLCLLLKSKPVL